MDKDKQAVKTVLFYSGLLIICLICVVYLHHLLHPLPQMENSYTVQEPILHGLYDVVRTVDGDTIVINLDGAETTIRLIGVDTPESVHPDASRNTDEGKIASEWLADLLADQQVYIEYDEDHTDDYGRTLAYVWLDDGCTMVEEELLRAGYASVLTIRPNDRYAVRFSRLETEAKENTRGFWNTDK